MEKVKKYFTLTHDLLSTIFYSTLAIIVIFMLFSILISIIKLEDKNIKNITNSFKESHFIGYKPIVILTGSMETKIKQYSIVIGKKNSSISNLNVGDVITYKVIDNDYEKKITHRIVNINKKKKTVYTKGDNNRVSDMYDQLLYPYGIPEKNIEYKIVFVINFVSPFVKVFMSDTTSKIMAIIGIIGLIALYYIVLNELYTNEYKLSRYIKKGDNNDK